jgi:hypothetical protein
MKLSGRKLAWHTQVLEFDLQSCKNKSKQKLIFKPGMVAVVPATLEAEMVHSHKPKSWRSALAA